MALLEHLDIVAAACAEIGEDAIGDFFDDGEENAAAAHSIYETVLDFNLGLYANGFQFAKELRPLTRVVLPDGTTPLSGYDYIFDPPVENVIGPAIYVTDDPSDPDRRFSRYALIAGQVHADPEKLWQMVPFRPEPYRWTAVFRAATITALAAKYALSLGHDRGTMEALTIEAYGTPSQNFRGGKMGAAIAAETFSTPPRRQDRDSNPLTRARTGG